uniref:Fibronectin type-III domain-containing protein n=1 Tax=Macrostomum lignano TaxID=282301 RepID=A0A1I8FLB3_9PLAT
RRPVRRRRERQPIGLNFPSPVEGESETDLALPGAAMLLLRRLCRQQQSNDSELQQSSSRSATRHPSTNLRHPRVRVMPVGSDRVRRGGASVPGKKEARRRGGAGSGGEAESQGAARRSWSWRPSGTGTGLCGGLETGCDYILSQPSKNSSSLGERHQPLGACSPSKAVHCQCSVDFSCNDVDASQKASSSKQKVQMLQKEQQQPPPIPQPRLFAVSSGPNRSPWPGYQLLINGARRGGLLPSQTSQTTLEPLRPGRTIRVAVQAAAFVSSSSGEDGRVGENEDDDFRLGRRRRLSGSPVRGGRRRRSHPCRPPRRRLRRAAARAATVSWRAPQTMPGVSRYRRRQVVETIFITCSDLQPGLACEVQVKAIAGSDESELSQPPLRVTGASVTQSPELKLEALDSDAAPNAKTRFLDEEEEEEDVYDEDDTCSEVAAEVHPVAYCEYEVTGDAGCHSASHGSTTIHRMLRRLHQPGLQSVHLGHQQQADCCEADPTDQHWAVNGRVATPTEFIGYVSVERVLCSLRFTIKDIHHVHRPYPRTHAEVLPGQLQTAIRFRVLLPDESEEVASITRRRSSQQRRNRRKGPVYTPASNQPKPPTDRGYQILRRRSEPYGQPISGQSASIRGRRFAGWCRVSFSMLVLPMTNRSRNAAPPDRVLLVKLRRSAACGAAAERTGGSNVGPSK